MSVQVSFLLHLSLAVTSHKDSFGFIKPGLIYQSLRLLSGSLEIVFFSKGFFKMNSCLCYEMIDICLSSFIGIIVFVMLQIGHKNYRHLDQGSTVELHSLIFPTGFPGFKFVTFLLHLEDAAASLQTSDKNVI